jgi:hypothetical protein
MAENIFNKTIGGNGGRPAHSGFHHVADAEAIPKGTLVGNWYEERALRTFTGVGRTIVREHIPKKHLNFEEPIKTEKKFDNTHDRIHGIRLDQPMYSENYHYGKGVNPADALPKVGLKNKRLEREMYELIASELNEKEEALERERQARRFETTTGATYAQKDLTENTVGRWLMKTQDGVAIGLDKTAGRGY